MGETNLLVNELSFSVTKILTKFLFSKFTTLRLRLPCIFPKQDLDPRHI